MSNLHFCKHAFPEYEIPDTDIRQACGACEEEHHGDQLTSFTRLHLMCTVSCSMSDLLSCTPSCAVLSDHPKAPQHTYIRLPHPPATFMSAYTHARTGGRAGVTCDVAGVVSHKQHPTIHSSRSKGRAPVPPKVSRGLPQKVVMGYHMGQLQAMVMLQFQICLVREHHTACKYIVRCSMRMLHQWSDAE